MKNKTHISFLYLTVLITWFLNLPVQAQWIELNSGIKESFTASYFVNRDTGYVVGKRGVIIKTTSGGGNWETLNSGTTISLNEVYFTSENNGFIAADSGFLLITENGGFTWVSKHLDSARNINAVFFVNSMVGFVAGNDTFLSKTTDGGKTWLDLIIDDNTPVQWNCENFKALYFFDENTGYVAGGSDGGAGIMFKTNDGGFTWHAFDSNFCYQYPLSKISCFSQKTCFCVTGLYLIVNNPTTSSKVIRIDDDSADVLGGIINSSFNDIYMTPQGIGYIAGSGFIYKTSDFFVNNWVMDSSHSGTFRDLFFVDNDVGYIVGTGGVILKTTNAGLGIETKDTRINEIALYPNPTNNKISITFSLNHYGPVSCIIHDLIGQKANILINKAYYNPGNYTKDFNISFLKPGIYFFTFQSNSHSTTKKIVKVE